MFLSLNWLHFCGWLTYNFVKLAIVDIHNFDTRLIVFCIYNLMLRYFHLYPSHLPLTKNISILNKTSEAVIFILCFSGIYMVLKTCTQLFSQQSCSSSIYIFILGFFSMNIFFFNRTHSLALACSSVVNRN